MQKHTHIFTHIHTHTHTPKHTHTHTRIDSERGRRERGRGRERTRRGRGRGVGGRGTGEGRVSLCTPALTTDTDQICRGRRSVPPGTVLSRWVKDLATGRPSTRQFLTQLPQLEVTIKNPRLSRDQPITRHSALQFAGDKGCLVASEQYITRDQRLHTLC